MVRQKAGSLSRVAASRSELEYVYSSLPASLADTPRWLRAHRLSIWHGLNSTPSCPDQTSLALPFWWGPLLARRGPSPR